MLTPSFSICAGQWRSVEGLGALAGLYFVGVSPFMRKVRTSWGATAVQIVEKIRGQRKTLEHIGSARTECELAA